MSGQLCVLDVAFLHQLRNVILDRSFERRLNEAVQVLTGATEDADLRLKLARQASALANALHSSETGKLAFNPAVLPETLSSTPAPLPLKAPAAFMFQKGGAAKEHRRKGLQAGLLTAVRAKAWARRASESAAQQ